MDAFRTSSGDVGAGRDIRFPEALINLTPHAVIENAERELGKIPDVDPMERPLFQLRGRIPIL